jgi:ribonuclease P/MRP protein subunit POP1
METHIYKPGTYPFGLISPITIMWQPICPKPASNAVVAQGAAESSDKASDPSAGKKKQKQNKGKRSKGKQPEPPLDSESSRTVWIRSHPAVFEDVFGALQTAASLALDSLRKNTTASDEGQEVEIELADLRGHVNVFELMGPKASQIIKGALTPVGGEKREEFSKVCRVSGTMLIVNVGSSGGTWVVYRLLDRFHEA